MQGMLQQLQLQHDFLRNQSENASIFVATSTITQHCSRNTRKKNKNVTSDEERFTILYTLLEGAPEKPYNQHISKTDKSEALKEVWRDLKDNFGYRDQNPLVNVDKRSARSPVQSTPKGLFWATCAIAGPEMVKNTQIT